MRNGLIQHGGSCCLCGRTGHAAGCRAHGVVRHAGAAAAQRSAQTDHEVRRCVCAVCRRSSRIGPAKSRRAARRHGAQERIRRRSSGSRSRASPPATRSGAGARRRRPSCTRSIGPSDEFKAAGLKDAQVETFAVPGTMWVPTSWQRADRRRSRRLAPARRLSRCSRRFRSPAARRFRRQPHGAVSSTSATAPTRISPDAT